MNYQRGFILAGLSLGQTIVKLGLVLAIVSAIGGIVYAVKSYIGNRDAAIYAAGQGEANVAWQNRELEREALNRQLVKKMSERYAAEQTAHALAVTNLTKDYRNGQRQATKRHKFDLARIRAGTLRLRDPGRSDKAPGVGGPIGGGKTSAGTAAAGTVGAGGGQLSRSAAEFLLGQADSADRVVRKLTSLQGYTMSLWGYCGGVASK